MQLTHRPVDVSVLQRLVGDNREIIRDVLRTFQSTSLAIRADLHAAYRSGKWLDVSAAAHKLKSSARTVGASKLADRCDEIETAVTIGRFEEINQLVGLFDETIVEVDRYLQAHQNNET